MVGSRRRPDCQLCWVPCPLLSPARTAPRRAGIDTRIPPHAIFDTLHMPGAGDLRRAAGHVLGEARPHHAQPPRRRRGRAVQVSGGKSWCAAVPPWGRLPSHALAAPILGVTLLHRHHHRLHLPAPPPSCPPAGAASTGTRRSSVRPPRPRCSGRTSDWAAGSSQRWRRSATGTQRTKTTNSTWRREGGLVRRSRRPRGAATRSGAMAELAQSAVKGCSDPIRCYG